MDAATARRMGSILTDEELLNASLHDQEITQDDVDTFDYGDVGKVVIAHLIYIGVGSVVHPMIVRDAIYREDGIFEVALEPCVNRVVVGDTVALIRHTTIVFMAEGDPYETMFFDNVTGSRKRIKRVSSNTAAKHDAYSDPAVAAMAELTTSGLKTRAGFYKRSKTLKE